MKCPLLVYKEGKFTIADPVPDWYGKMESDEVHDWEAVIRRAGFRPAESVNESRSMDHVSVFIRDDETTFYAECWDVNEQLWGATFGWEDWPEFLARYVLPTAHSQALCKLEQIHSEIVEYLVRNEPGNPEAQRREEAYWEAARRKANARRSA